jgi:hypothetical protein
VRRLEGTLSCEGDPGVEELRFVNVGELGEYMPVPSIGSPLRGYFGDPEGRAQYWFFPEYTAG